MVPEWRGDETSYIYPAILSPGGVVRRVPSQVEGERGRRSLRLPLEVREERGLMKVTPFVPLTLRGKQEGEGYPRIPLS
jgi:hypothetical protein